ncbi:MAG: substrate-binding domain-containing protein [Planctomycetaceae bacterium]|nr:substrate-binding domain-containing protein [Planctomycetaceae bacterium]
MYRLPHITFVAAFLLLTSVGCGKKEPPVIYIYCSELYWNTMWEEAELFKHLYQVRVVLIPILPETAAAETPDSGQKPAMPAPSNSGNRQNRRINTPWHSRPQIQRTFSPELLLLDTKLTGLITSFAEGKQYGDLYVSESPEQTGELQRYSLIKDEYPFAYLTLQLLVAKENPNNVKTVQDILVKKLKVGIVAPSRFGMGSAAWDVLSKASQQVLQSERSAKETLYNQVQIYNNRQDLIAAMAKGEVDAAFVWDVLVSDTVSFADVVPLQGDERICAEQSIISLRIANEPGHGRRFADFLTSPKGKYILYKHGFVSKPL